MPPPVNPASPAADPLGQVDPRFRAARESSARRRRRGLAVRLIGAGGLVAALAAGLWWGAGLLRSPLPGDDTASAPASQAVPVRTETDASSPAVDDAALMDAFLDIPGDPLRLRFGTGDRGASVTRPRPQELPPGRGQGDVVILRDVMVSSEDRLVTALPSSREDFAIFQAQRRGLAAVGPAGDDTTTTPDGEVLVAVASASPEAAQTRAHPRTATEAAAYVTGAGGRIGHGRLQMRPAAARAPLTEDAILRIASPRALVDILRGAGLSADEGRTVARAAAGILGLEAPEPGQVIALRILRPEPGSDAPARFAQLALYSGDGYVGAMAREDGQPEARSPTGPPPATDGAGDEQVAPPGFTAAADPWLGENLLAMAAAGPEGATGPARFRIIDAFYSAAMRHRLPTGLVGEIIMLLSEAHDLDAEAAPGDRMTLVRSAEPPDAAEATLGQVLYVAIEGNGVDIRCYVYQPAPGRPHSCFGARRGGAAGLPAAAADSLETGLSDETAVEQLVDRIIVIESAGVADARNPLSTATGLGQFIESTWIRMMRTYRPDLYTSLPRDELLGLRTDPAISRAMVVALAREGEAYLRARGHQITAGRLYLSHFLGMEGAHLVLTQPADAMLEAVLGPAVIRANPFLTDRDVAYIVAWAEDRMRGAGRGLATREPAGLVALRGIVDGLLRDG